ncbi:MAG: hypothetical protein GY943_39710 [Chloroflexi bacterium]|nr:hypothetical protein [Chloroflexota bacterium]
MNTNMTPEDDLFSPSLQEETFAAHYKLKPPWRVQQQIWIAFFGGPVSATVVAFLNGHRLHLKQKELLTMIAVGVIGVVVTIVTAVLLTDIQFSSDLFQSSTQQLRYISRIVGVLTYLIFARMQKSADRIYHYRNNGKYDALLGPGLAIVLIAGTLQNVLISGIVNIFS